MAQTAYPKSGGATTDDQYRDFIRNVVDSGVLASGDYLVVGDSSGMNVKAASGIAFVDGITAKSTATETLTIGTAPAAPNSRRDTIVLQLDYTQTPIVQLKVIAGTPGTSPAAPSLTPAGNVKFNLPLADVLVGSGVVTINPSDVTDRRAFTGTNVGLWTNDTRPASPRNGRLGLNLTNGGWEWYDGGSWVALGSTTFDAAAITTGTLNSNRLPVVPITKGGTGATTAAAARTALGITPAAIGAQESGSYAAASHTHDDRYFTETEVTSALAGKANTSHTHAYSSLTSIPSSFTPSAHNHASLNDGGYQWFRAGDNKWSATNSGGISVGGSVEAGAYLRTAAGWNYNITGTRRAVWMDSSGILGHTDSTAKTKKGITPVTKPDGAIFLTRDQLRLIQVSSYQRTAELAREKKERGYRAPTEIGVVAEQLHKAGLWPFVMYDGRGEKAVPVGVHYEILALAAIQLAQYVADDLDELARRVGDLERIVLAHLEGKE